MNATVDLEHLIRTLVYGLHDGHNSVEASGLEPDPRYTRALCLAFNITARYKDECNTASIEFLFNRPWGSRGFATTHTFARVWDEPWEHLSSHDSEWGVSDYLWKVEQSLHVNHDIPMAEHHWHTCFLKSDQVNSWLPVVINLDPNDQNRWRRTIQIV